MSAYYRTTTKNNIRDSLILLLFYGLIIAISIFISRFGKLYFLTWLPILWSIYMFFSGIFIIWTTTFFLEEDKLIVRSILNVTTVIYWTEIKKIKLVRSKSKITGIKIFTKGKDKDLMLNDAIENYEELFNKILSKVKEIGTAEIT